MPYAPETKKKSWLEQAPTKSEVDKAKQFLSFMRNGDKSSPGYAEGEDFMGHIIQGEKADDSSSIRQMNAFRLAWGVPIVLSRNTDGSFVLSNSVPAGEHGAPEGFFDFVSKIAKVIPAPYGTAIGLVADVGNGVQSAISPIKKIQAAAADPSHPDHVNALNAMDQLHQAAALQAALAKTEEGHRIDKERLQQQIDRMNGMSSGHGGIGPEFLSRFRIGEGYQGFVNHIKHK